MKHISILYRARKRFSTASAVGVLLTASGSSVAKVNELAIMMQMQTLSKILLEMIFSANMLI